MEIEYISPKDLTPYAKNAKRHPDEQVEHIANSIKEFGFKQPIVIDKGNVVVIGHGRLMAAKKLKLDKVPCIRADDLTEAQIKALRLADNKTNESEWDIDILSSELEGLNVDMTMFGFDEWFEDDDEKEIIEDEPPELPEEPKSKLGDIYRLGAHRLVCGDSTNIDVIKGLVDGENIDLLLTDPPYNVDVGSCDRPYSNNNGIHIQNDSMPTNEFIGFLTSALKNAENVMRGGARHIIYGIPDFIILSLKTQSKT